MLIYLTDVPDGLGGETRFPLVGASADSPLLTASQRMLGYVRGQSVWGASGLAEDVHGLAGEWSC